MSQACFGQVKKSDIKHQSMRFTHCSSVTALSQTRKAIFMKCGRQCSELAGGSSLAFHMISKLNISEKVQVVNNILLQIRFAFFHMG